MFFSVIVPVYNVEKYLSECIESVLMQTFSDFELLLVDDGSKDDSGKICDQYEAKDNRIKVIHKENGGQSTARNCGVKEAQGQYVIFLDSDDFIASNHFFADIKANLQNDEDIVIFRYCKYYNENKIDDCNISLASISFQDKGELFAELVKRDAFFCSCWSKCIALKILKKNNVMFDENMRCEDMDWYYSVLQYAQTFAVIDQPYIQYRQRENSVTTGVSVKNIRDYCYTINKWNKVFSQMPEGMEKNALMSSLAKLYCNLLISYARNYKKLKECKKEIFSFKPLLRYTMNPRTRMIRKFSKYFGLNITCFALRILDKKRK